MIPEESGHRISDQAKQFVCIKTHPFQASLAGMDYYVILFSQTSSLTISVGTLVTHGRARYGVVTASGSEMNQK